MVILFLFPIHKYALLLINALVVMDWFVAHRMAVERKGLFVGQTQLPRFITNFSSNDTFYND